jgi:CubicO group peptidase (beta-lactamase class C family)
MVIQRHPGSFALVRLILLFSIINCLILPAHPGVAQSKVRPACEGASLRDVKPCMQSFVDDGSIIGLVTLLDRKGLALELASVGQYKPDSIFQIMSMSKPFVAVGIMVLLERGKIPSVDSKVSELPGFQDFPYRDVTIKQLLTHTSGVWYKHKDKSGPLLGIEPLLTNRLDKEPGITIRDKPLAFVAKHYANPELYPLDLAPRQYHYSNIGYLMLGWVIERLSGRPLDQFMKTEIFDKLGMKDTFYFPALASADQRSRIADLDRRLPDPPDYSHYDKARAGFVYASPAGGIYSTAQDLRLFLSLFRHKGQIPGHERILQPRSIKLLMEDQIRDLKSGCEGWSLGFSVLRSGCPRPTVHSSGTIYHNGRFSTWFWYDPVKDEIGMILYQRVTSEDYPFEPIKVLPQLISSITKQ